jgi:hypothetical protein
MALKDEYMDIFNQHKRENAYQALSDAYDAYAAPSVRANKDGYSGFTTLLNTNKTQPQLTPLPLATPGESKYMLASYSSTPTAGAGAETAGDAGGYQSLGTYNDTQLSPEEMAQVNAYKQQYAAAQAAGDTAGMEAAHAGAESIRARHGYSGGVDGSGYYAVTPTQPRYTAGKLPSASSAESYINDMYAAQQASALQALESAYETNMNTLNATGEKIPAYYYAAANDAGAQAAIQKANFNEQAAASGLNSGAGGQAALSMGNQLQGNLSNIQQQKANALADLELQRTQLSTAYQNDIAQAIADGNLAKAQALYDDFVRVDNSIVETARAQQDEYYRAAAFANSQYTDNRNYNLSLADKMAQYGVFSGYDGILKPEQIEGMSSYFEGLQTPTKTSGGGGKGGTNDGGPTPQPSDSGEKMSAAAQSTYDEAVYRMGFKGASAEDIMDYLGAMVDVYKKITQAEAKAIMNQLVAAGII